MHRSLVVIFVVIMADIVTNRLCLEQTFCTIFRWDFVVFENREHLVKMPVYLRQHNDIPTPTISDIGENDEDDFLQDPDQRWDKLPQPFRFLNKILISVFERAWEIANSREVERITEAAKIRPPQYECASNVKVTCVPPDGLLLVTRMSYLSGLIGDTPECLSLNILMMDIWLFLVRCKRSITPECGLLMVVGFKHSGVATSRVSKTAEVEFGFITWVSSEVTTNFHSGSGPTQFFIVCWYM